MAQQLADDRQQDADADAGARHDQRHRPVGQVLRRTASEAWSWAGPRMPASGLLAGSRGKVDGGHPFDTVSV